MGVKIETSPGGGVASTYHLKCDHPGCANDAPYGEGWPLRVEPKHWCREHLPHDFLPKREKDNDSS